MPKQSIRSTTARPRLIIHLAGAALLSLTAWGCAPSDEPIEGEQRSALERAAAAGHEYVDDSVLVRFRSGPTLAARQSSLARVQGTIEDKNADGVYDGFANLVDGEMAVVRLGPGMDVETAIAELSADPAVLYAEPNYIVHAIAAPNDPRFPELYGLDNQGQTGGTADADIDAVEAWDVSVGSPDVVVGVVDTGIDYTHEDLAGNVFVNPNEVAGDGVDNDGNGVVDDVHGFNAITGSGDPFDDNAHGSHCSGTIGGVGNNAIGVAGVNHDVTIMGIKFLGAGGSGTLEDAIEAINYAVGMKNAGVNLRVLSNSWAGGGFTQGLLDAINAANAVDILFVAAAGNFANDNDQFPEYPASYDAPNVVAVAATDHNDALAGFSNFGATSVDLGAPGVDVLSTTPGNTYQLFSGTSMATPHVSGVAALVLAINPTLPTAALRDVVLNSGDPVASLQGITVTGRRLNAAAALAAGAPATPP
jgi:serine protease